MGHKVGSVTAIIRDPDCAKVGLVGMLGEEDVIITCISTNVDTYFVQGEFICSYRLSDHI
jgi:hypothetical protein